MTPETRLVNKMTRRLKHHKVNGVKLWWIKVHGGPLQRAGTPDLLLCLNGQFVGVEVKTDDGKVSRIQKHTMKQINDANGWTCVCRSVEELDRIVLLHKFLVVNVSPYQQP